MSELKVDKITPRQGTTLTLGDSGDTINFGSGVLPNFENLTVTGDLTVDTNSLKVDSTNNFVGIGTASPTVALDVVGTANIGSELNVAGTSALRVNTSRVSIDVSGSAATPSLVFNGDTNTGLFRVSSDTIGISTAGTERMRIDSSGDFYLGTTDNTLYSATSGGGIYAVPNGSTTIARQSNIATQPIFILNETGVDGTLAEFRKDGTTVGSIGNEGTRLQINTPSGAGLSFNASSNIEPMKAGSRADNQIQLGADTIRFTDLYLAGKVTNDGSGGMSIDTSGNVTFNEGSIDADFRVESNNNTHALFVDGGNSTVSINSSDNTYDLQVTHSTSENATIVAKGTAPAIGLYDTTSGADNWLIYNANGSLTFYETANTNGFNSLTSRVRFTSDGKVGIGTTSPDAPFHTEASFSSSTIEELGRFSRIGGTASGSARSGVIAFEDQSNPTLTGAIGGRRENPGGNYNSGLSFWIAGLTGSPITSVSGLTEGMRLNANNYLEVFGGATFNQNSGDYDFRVESDSNTHALFVDASSNNVLIGTTDNSPAESSSNDGIRLGTNGGTQIGTNGLTVLALNRNSSDGIHIDIRRQGSRIGYIGTNTSNLGLGTADTGILFDDANDNIVPANPDNSLSSRDDVIDLGSTSTRFKHIYYSGSLGASASGGLSFDTNGNAVFNEGSSDSDFRVESNTSTHMLFVDAGNSRLGIHKSNPTTRVDVDGTVKATAFQGDGSALTGVGGETAFAYVNFNGTGTVSIRDDFNVSSITDNQTGDYSVNFSSSASSSNYTAAGHGGDPSQDGEPFWTQALSTSAYRGWLKVPNSGRNDRQYVMCTIHGG